jgi:hypothetical protein
LGSRSLRLPVFLNNWLINMAKVAIPTHRPPLPQGDIPGTHFC